MKFPKEILVYEFDRENGHPIFAVAKNVDDIPDDCSGKIIGVYVLQTTHKFVIKRELK